MGERLILLGTGTGVPSTTRSSSAYLVELGGKRILIDCGAGTLRRLLQIGLTYIDIDIILLTHTHPDHTSDLVPFLFGARYPSKPRREALPVVGGKGVSGFIDRLNSAFDGLLLSPYFDVDVREVEGEGWDWCGLRFLSLPVRHIDNSRGYRIEGGGVRLAFSGDTDWTERLIELAEGVDFFICEASFPDNSKVDGHLTPALAARIAEDASVKTLILTHLYPEVESEPIEDVVRKRFSGRVIIGRDLMEIPLKGGVETQP